MSFSFDRTGFPLFLIPDLAIEVHLLPVTKVQVEDFVADSAPPYGQDWYVEAVTLYATQQVRRIFEVEMKEEALRQLSDSLGVDYDELPGKGKNHKTQALIGCLESRYRITDVIQAGQNLFPQVQWPDAGKASAWLPNVQVACDRFAPNEREKLLMSGLLPQEALDFAAWLGEGFDLPSLDEWRAIYRALERTPVSVCQPLLQNVKPPARAILAQLLTHTQAKSVLDVSLMRGGLIEWVRRADNTWLGRGQPRQAFFANLFDPLSDKDEQIKPIQIRRSRYFGFRLVRREGRPVIILSVSVEAGQHIFTSVEKDQSPHGKEGFQTIFYTHALLSQGEAEDIETRLAYVLSETEPVDRLFFSIASGKRVVTQIVPLTEPDRFGRRGRYLAHSLVFEPAAFDQLAADPFDVFERFPFTPDVETALKSGHFESGDIEVVVREAAPRPRLAIPAQVVEAAAAWPLPALKRLVLLALQADQLARERLTLAFIGQPERVEEILRVTFLAVPTPLRPLCTFDTYFHRCSLANTYFWAVGLLERPNDPRFIVVDTHSRQISGGADHQPHSAYEQWVMGQLAPDNLNLLAHWRDYAFALCEWLDGHSDYNTTLVEEAALDIIESTFQANASKVQALLHGKLIEEALLPPRLVNRVAVSIYQRLRPIEHYRRLRQGFEWSSLVKLLYEVYKARDFQPPPDEELLDLGAILDKIELPTLRALYTCWSKQDKRLQRELERLSKEDYREFVQMALHVNLVDDPLALLSPARGEIFLDLYLASDRARDIVALTRALLDAREMACLTRLAPHVAGRVEGDIQTLQKIIRKRPDIPEAFQQAVLRAAQESLTTKYTKDTNGGVSRPGVSSPPAGDARGGRDDEEM